MKLTNLIYKILKKIIRSAGFNLILTRNNKKDTQYEPVFPNASYAPWLRNRPFIETFSKIKEYTLVDQYRCYELWQLVKESKKLNGALIEIGVWRGGTAALIAKQASLNGIKNKVYLCDTFTGVVKAGEKDFGYKGGEHSDASKEIVEELINKLELNNTTILTGIFPDETSKFIQDEKFRFCHIDVDVYQSSKDILEWLWPKLVVGGIVVFDDYGFQPCEGVTNFVNEIRDKEDRLVIHNLNGHAIIIKISN